MSLVLTFEGNTLLNVQSVDKLRLNGYIFVTFWWRIGEIPPDMKDSCEYIE